MFQNEFHISRLIAGHFRQELSAAQEEELKTWITSSPNRQAYFDELTDERVMSAQLKEFKLFNEQVKAEIWNNALIEINTSLSTPRRTVRKNTLVNKLWTGISIAAAILLIIGTIAILMNRPSDSGDQYLNAQNDIPAKHLIHIVPAKNGVTIKLANGKTIKLSDEKNGIVINRTSLKYKDGSVIENRALEDYKGSLELSTGFGQSYEVTLPDGTNVFLNAATTIKFPSSFKNSRSRSVFLKGEAFFKVVHNSRQPFQVLSKGQLVEDIGTAFNISAYEDDPSVQTTLIEGSAKIKALLEGKAKDISEEVTLIPNERNTLTKVNPFFIERIQLADVIAWKDGDFQFNKEKLSNITKKLERWYNVKFTLSDQVANKVFTGKIARSRSLNSVLKLMERTNSIHFIIEGRRISVAEK